MGMVKPDAGELYLETDGGRLDLTKKDPEEIVNLGVSPVPGGRRLFPALTVKENLLMGAYWGEARRKLEENVHLCFQNFLRHQGIAEKIWVSRAYDRAEL
jgi:branched-chain amino acid transport system ATP-binding protein